MTQPTPLGEVIAVAQWDSGRRWVVEWADMRPTDDLCAGRDEAPLVAFLLSQLATDEGSPAAEVTLSGDWLTVTAYGPPPVDVEDSRPAGIAFEAEGPSAITTPGRPGGEVPGAGVTPAPTTLTPSANALANHHRSTATIAAALRRVADAVAAIGDQAVPTVALSINMQVTRTSAAADAERIAAVDLLCHALGTTGRYHEMQHNAPGAWWYQEQCDSWDGVGIDVDAPYVAAPNDAGRVALGGAA